MSSLPARASVLAASLIIAMCAVIPACAMEKSMSVTAQARAVDAREVFSDPRVAELAEAVAQGDAARVRTLAAGVDLSTTGD